MGLRCCQGDSSYGALNAAVWTERSREPVDRWFGLGRSCDCRPCRGLREGKHVQHNSWGRDTISFSVSFSSAVIIVMVAGYTAGLHWELTTAVERGWARKLVFLFPPGDPYHVARWDWVMSVFRETETRTQMAQARRDGVIAMHIDAQSALVTFATERQSARSYQTALALAVYGKFLRQDGVLQLPSDW